MWEYIIPGLVLILMIVCYFRFFKSLFSPVKKVKAQLVEKYVYTRVSKSQANSKEYVLVFETEKGKISFNVPEFSYGGYKVKKRGTLKYKGNRILEFK